MKLVATVASICALASVTVQAADSKQIVKQFEKELSAQKVGVTTLVTKYGKLAEENICDVVRAAIVLAEADSAKVSQIVEAAIKVNPKKAREIVNVAVAIAPDSHDSIMKSYLKFAPSAGVSSSSDAKGSKEAKGGKGDQVGDEGDGVDVPNPLNFPKGTTKGATGPTNGGNGGNGLIPPGGGGPRIVTPPTPQTVIPPVSPF